MKKIVLLSIAIITIALPTYAMTSNQISGLTLMNSMRPKNNSKKEAPCACAVNVTKTIEGITYKIGVCEDVFPVESLFFVPYYIVYYDKYSKRHEQAFKTERKRDKHYRILKRFLKEYKDNE